MKMQNCARGPMWLCLALLAACTTAPPSPAPTVIANTCARVTPCTLPALSLRTNGDLRAALDATESAWAECAAQIDMIATCQARADDEKAQ